MLLLIVVGIVLLIMLLLSYIFYPAFLAATTQRRSNVLLVPKTIGSTNESNNNNTDTAQQLLLEQPLLSVVIPAYNEQDRLTFMLQPALDYLSSPNCPALEILANQNRRNNKNKNDNNNNNGVLVEWLLVSDGSTDATEQVYQKFVQSHDDPPQQQYIWRILVLERNSGKGAAVRAGMMAATGSYCLMVDADGATQFDHLALLAKEISSSSTTSSTTSSSPCVWGSRAHLQNAQTPEHHRRGLLREILMRGFHGFVRLLCTTRGSTYIRDTQCGFKLFTREAAQLLFTNLHISGWAFDTELLILAAQLRLNITEVPVNWHEVDGSKLSTSPWNLAYVAATMLRDMICVRLCYELGIWKIHPPPPPPSPPPSINTTTTTKATSVASSTKSKNL